MFYLTCFFQGHSTLNYGLVRDMIPVAGTRFGHEVFCELGVPSVHFTQACNVGKEGRKALSRFMKVNTRLRNCIPGEPNQEITKSPECETQPYLKELREALIGFLTSGVQVVADTPYNHYLAQYLQLIPDLKVLSSRVCACKIPKVSVA